MSFAPVRFAIYLGVAFLVLATLSLLPGVFHVTGHEIDLIQAVDIAYRMSDGLIPHVDFMTPLGVLAFQPIGWFLEAGYGPGRAFLLANVLVTLTLLPAIWWVGMSRLDGGVRVAFGLGMVALGLSMVFGGANPAIMASMYYNRWAWIPAFCVILMLLLPARPGWRSPLVDGVLIGLAGGALVLVKVTYVIALLPFALRAIISTGQWRLFGWAAATAIALLGWATVSYGGFALWPAYIGDLMAVAFESDRTNPGTPLSDLVASPATLSMTLVLLLVIVFWRRVRMKGEGIAMLLLAPGLVYITFQNWGNDPKWLFLMAIILLSLLPPETARPFWGVPPRVFSKVLAVVCLVLYAPSMMNIATSQIRHFGKDHSKTTYLFPGDLRSDIRVDVPRNFEPKMQLPLEGIDYPADYAKDENESEDDKPLTVNGEEILDCSLNLGFVGWTRTAIEQLGAIPEAVGRHVLVADVYDHLWLLGPFARNDGMAPWYYGTSGGFDEVEFIMVPLCAVSQGERRSKLERIHEMGWTLEEVARTDLFILYRRAG